VNLAQTRSDLQNILYDIDYSTLAIATIGYSKELTMDKKLPFILGSQYYRAPTPGPECWEQDFDRMQKMRMNSVKFWVQWRWTHREGDRWVFDDVDRLMDLALAHDLDVHINVIFDVAPDWLYEVYPDAKMIMNNGRIVEPFEVAHRQIGGHPGPCYNHPGALEERKKFFRKTLEHFREHPAMGWWDVWNEPELCFPSRDPNLDTLTCYCPNCHSAFQGWLQKKYGTIEVLNAVWGRCYEKWERVEMPRNGQCITDFVDWRQFQTDTMTGEARWRLEMAQEMAPKQRSYLHVVSTTYDCFTHTTCAADNFALSDLIPDIFAASTGAHPPQMQQSLSAAKGKTFYNTESHINFGMTHMHPRIIDETMTLSHFLPQLGVGMKGFMTWQFRAERLGFESPAWGIVRPDGSDRPATKHIEALFKVFAENADALMACPKQAPTVGLWESPSNEYFHFATRRNLAQMAASYTRWHELLYWTGYDYACINDKMVANNELEHLKLLIMPDPYFLTADQVAGLDSWVRDGGVLITEAHLGAYNGNEGRHSLQVPGFGLDKSWGISEIESTSSMHLRLDQVSKWSSATSPDVQKMLNETGSGGGRFYPIQLETGTVAIGCDRFAILGGEGIEPLGSFDDRGPIIAGKQVGKGYVIYCGTSLGEGSLQGAAGALEIIAKAASKAGVTPICNLESNEPLQVRFDILADDMGPRFIVIQNRSRKEQTVKATLPACRGIFTGKTFTACSQELVLPAEYYELAIVE
jgi:beta-galactosidase